MWVIHTQVFKSINPHLCHSETSPVLKHYARQLNHLNTYAIVRGHHMNSARTSTVYVTALNFHSGACIVTHQNKTSCHAKS